LSSPNPISTAPPPPLPPQRTPPLSSFLFPSYLPPRDLHSFPTRRSSDLSALRLFPPGLEVALDLARVLLQVLRVDREPVLRAVRSEEHTSELQSLAYLVCRLLLEKKNTNKRAGEYPSNPPNVGEARRRER